MQQTQTIGTCSLCGGRVTVPTFWWGVVPPEPTCEECGAVMSYGPTIPMQPAPQTYTASRCVIRSNTAESEAE